MSDIFAGGNLFMNLDNSHRFVVIAQVFKYVGVDDGTTGAMGSPSGFVVDEYREIDQQQVFGGTDATISSITTGALLLVLQGQGVSPNGFSAEILTRVRFTDQ